MKRADAVIIADDLVNELVALCEKIEIAGSIRRCKETVNDIDLVCLPKPGQLRAIKQRLWTLAAPTHATVTGGDKYLKLSMYKGIQVDVYIADATTWATLLLIRTGSREHNILLCQKARAMGLKLNADGHGLTWISKDVNVPVHTEDAIFKELGLPYKEPMEREA
jgi:DNA polymerase (family 10)